MSIRVYAVSTDPRTVSEIEIDGKKALTTLGPQEEAMAVQLKELFTSIADSISGGLEFESQVAVEISGSISLRVQGSAKYLFFNIGAESTAQANMKVSLSTTLKPKKPFDAK